MRFACLTLLVLLVSCGSSNRGGAPCGTSAECQMGLVCLPAGTLGADGGAGEAHVCMRHCDYDGGTGVEQHLCADGTVCLAIEGMNVCYRGGSHAIDTACTDDAQCEGGTICASDTRLCAQACTLGTNTPCRTNETCADVSGGICRATVVVLDGGT